MKRLVIGILTLSILLGASITLSVLFARIHLPAAEELTQATAAVQGGDWDRALQLFSDAQQRWDHHRRFTAAFADHGPMDEIEGLFARGHIYAHARDSTRFPALCAHLAQLTQAMADSHRLAWWTLL